MTEADEMDLTFEDAAVGAWNDPFRGGRARHAHLARAAGATRRAQRRGRAQSGGGPVRRSVHGLQQPRDPRLELQAAAGARRRSGHRGGRRLATEGALHHGDRPRDPDLRRRRPTFPRTDGLSPGRHPPSDRRSRSRRTRRTSSPRDCSQVAWLDRSSSTMRPRTPCGWR